MASVQLTPGMTREDFDILMSLNGKRMLTCYSMLNGDQRDYKVMRLWDAMRVAGMESPEIALFIRLRA